MSAIRSVLGLIGLVTGCNAVHGLDPTELADDHMRTLIFDNSASKIDLVDFPVLVVLDSTRIRYEEVAAPATQLRFFDPDSAQDLAFEVERWDPAGRSYIWVKVPQIDAGSTTDQIELHFGAQAGGLEKPSDVWSRYAFVYHGMPGKLASSIGNAPGTATNVVTTDSAIASGPRFADGVESGIVFANTGSLLSGRDRFSFEFWIYPDYAPSYDLGNREPQYFTTEGAVSLGRLRTSDVGIDSLLTSQIDVQFDTVTSYAHPPIQRQAWAYTVYTFDGQVMWIYRDGARVDLDDFDRSPPVPPPTRLISAPGQIVIGSTNEAMAGMIDELRVSPSGLPADWVDAQFRSMTGKLVTFSIGGSR